MLRAVMTQSDEAISSWLRSSADFGYRSCAPTGAERSKINTSMAISPLSVRPSDFSMMLPILKTPSANPDKFFRRSSMVSVGAPSP